MHMSVFFSLAMGFIAMTAGSPALEAAEANSPRLELAADANWKFLLGDPAEAQATSFDDAKWRTLNLPHDWSIEGIPAENSPTGAGGGYYPAGVGWYRKGFTAPASWNGKRVSIEFDGVAGNTAVYLNGHELGVHPYAYTSFRFDITSQVKLAGNNILALRVDNSEQPDSRWYSGSGIYRHVHVVVTDAIHVAPWGVFVSTPSATAASATIVAKTQVENDASEAATITVKTFFVGPTGAKTKAALKEIQVPPGQHAEVSQEIMVSDPALWSPQNPRLYRAVTQIVKDGKTIDSIETPFGIRSISWSAEKGLLLNGVSIKLVGGSVHHDNGPLGAAAFDRAEERKVQLLKAAGFNAVRSAHNPPSPAFLDACDRLGLLVIDEPFDVWTVSKRKYDYAQFFKEWWERDLDAMVMRDRNHPSIILWGIGNEIPEVWTAEGAPLAKQLSSRVRSLDPTKPLTQAFPGATYGTNEDAAISQVDIAGYNYNLAQNHAEDHRRVPERIMMTTESLPADAFEQWRLVNEHPYIVGEFVWTAMDYLGESGIGAWSYGTAKQSAQLAPMKNFLRAYLAKMGADGKNPMAPFQNGQPPSPIAPGFPWHAAYCGDMDLTGFRKPWSYYRDILWNGGDRVFMAVRLPENEERKILAPGWSVYPALQSWTWPGEEGENLQVEVYAGTEKVRLFLNDKLMGEMPTTPDHERRALFTVPYAPGRLKLVGVNGDREVARSVLQTASSSTNLSLKADRSELYADGQDLSFITVEAHDSRGTLVPNSGADVEFRISGPGTIIAVGNGDGKSMEPYQADHRRLFNGRAIVVVRTSDVPGSIHLEATAPEMKSASIALQTSGVGLSAQLR